MDNLNATVTKKILKYLGKSNFIIILFQPQLKSLDECKNKCIVFYKHVIDQEQKPNFVAKNNFRKC